MRNKREALPAAVSLLARRDYSEYELRCRLQAKGYDELAVGEAVRRLKERGYLNEAALCHALYSKWINSGKFGLKSIVYKLKQRGFSEDMIQEMMAGYDLDAEQERAYILIKKRFGELNWDGQKQKIVRYLNGKGFTDSIIARIFDQIQ
ncbi:hypothetical protein P22_2252 [Propionispora sp. 2/2-37]|uniref:regulatory protein RecX n=1 Tax=Propionispora sp. 2/2-37 TaxID=1677858 RepID=UPI0006BB74E1|nr:regulatory protein RecX [Propionispora sp. 2/2-37]CUH96164.1 hypothetical protein P22_2252 [Propionispora sp. 2/2-37]